MVKKVKVEHLKIWIESLKKSRIRWRKLRKKGDKVVEECDKKLGYDAQYYLRGKDNGFGSKTGGIIANHIRHYKNLIESAGYAVPHSGIEDEVVSKLLNIGVESLEKLSEERKIMRKSVSKKSVEKRIPVEKRVPVEKRIPVEKRVPVTSKS